MMRRALALAAWASILVAVAVGGDALLVGPLAPPGVLDPGSWASWAGARTPIHAAFAVTGLAVVALAWYLLAVTALQVSAHVMGAARLVALSDVVTLPAVRRSVHAVLGLGLAGSVVAAGAARSLPPVIGGPMALVATAAPLEAEPPDSEAPVMRRLPDPAPVPKERQPEPGEAPPAVEEWTVAPGDHLWSVAARVLEAAWERVPADDEVGPYWRRLVAANSDRLADPANPDLIYPGQRLAVVEPPTPR